MAQTCAIDKGTRLIVQNIMLGGLVALLCGLDRIAVFQVMISRPLVAAPLAAWLLGSPGIGLQIGIMVELLWLARLPVGAAIPPDDTQVAVAAAVLAVLFSSAYPNAGLELVILCLLVTLPLGKIGQFFDHYARQYNNRLPKIAESCLARGELRLAELQHVRGLLSFVLAIAGTYLFIISGGLLLFPMLWPLVQQYLQYSTNWLMLALPLIGISVILGTINVSRAITLFSASFGMALLLLWLV